MEDRNLGLGRRVGGVMQKLVFVAILSLGAIGCTPSYIPNTDVEDTSDNRNVVSFCEEYRHAVEEKDVGKLLKLASPRYFEDGGNTNPDDDIDFDGLKDYLTSTFVKTQTIRYEIRYRKVVFGENKKVYVEYSYSASYRIPGLKGEEWKHTVADNRLELSPEGESFKILAGM
jgi:hypothetical protein